MPQNNAPWDVFGEQIGEGLRRQGWKLRGSTENSEGTKRRFFGAPEGAEHDVEIVSGEYASKTPDPPGHDCDGEVVLRFYPNRGGHGAGHDNGA